MTSGTSAPRQPLPSLEQRRSGSVRRTMHVDVGARHGWGVELPITGAARDLRTDELDVPPRILSEAKLEAAFDGQRALVELRASPSPPWLAELVGTRAGGGFRRRLEQVVPPGDRRSLLRQVLDDMPAAVLISGYGFMRMARRQGMAPETFTPPAVLDRMVDLCSGWRRDGAAMSSVAAGRGVPMQNCPPAPETVDPDPWAFHDLPALELDAMRRRRCLDVELGPDGSLAVWATFRDTVGEPGGGESVLHEYALLARVEDGVLVAIEAEPRVLPFVECPAAAEKVGVLVGVALADLAGAVPERLVGTDCCTHLNDLLRALAGLADLTDLVGPGLAR